MENRIIDRIPCNKRDYWASMGYPEMEKEGDENIKGEMVVHADGLVEFVEGDDSVDDT